ncbi:MAG: type II toxin-antitoxin system HipA family toxin [Zhongshania sp.]|nr:type II toxin-antitoxin system HipA family toxin [Zhongshania sp.]
MDTVTIEIYRDGEWLEAATISVAGHSHLDSSRLQYDDDYAIAHIQENTQKPAGLGCNYPVELLIRDIASWPAFLLDLLPSGAGRDHWVKRLGISDGHHADLELLLHGAGSPPGNLRIREAAMARDPNMQAPGPDGIAVAMTDHPGFTLDEICERQEHFIEYAYQNGAHTSGASDVAGVAPKFLMVLDEAGRWHAEGALPDAAIASSWLIKFPRGKTDSDRQVLRLEATYMKLAKAVGIRVHGELQWTRNTLLIPRFDRPRTAQGLQRIGMESLLSLTEICRYGGEAGGSPSHNVLLNALIAHTTDPQREVTEYLKRDSLNIALGNKDNHGRNTAVFRHEDGRVELTPLFDFAPMYLDPEGIARVSRWEGDQEKGGIPIWEKVIDAMPAIINKKALITELKDFGLSLTTLTEIMAREAVDPTVITQRKHAIEREASALLNLEVIL